MPGSRTSQDATKRVPAKRSGRAKDFGKLSRATSASSVEPFTLTRGSISLPFRLVTKGDRKPVPGIDAHHRQVEVNEFLLGENADSFRVDFVRQMMHRD